MPGSKAARRFLITALVYLGVEVSTRCQPLLALTGSNPLGVLLVVGGVFQLTGGVRFIIELTQAVWGSS
jgi:hypothetical protein